MGIDDRRLCYTSPWKQSLMSRASDPSIHWSALWWEWCHADPSKMVIHNSKRTLVLDYCPIAHCTPLSIESLAAILSGGGHPTPIGDLL